MTVNAATLYDIIGYQFKQIDMLDMALTHKSLNGCNYERLEFLGDSILNFVVSKYLIEFFPKINEGELTIRRSNLINKKSLLSKLRIKALSPCPRKVTSETFILFFELIFWDIKCLFFFTK